MPHPPGVRLAMLHQIPADALSFWSVSRGYHIKIGVRFSSGSVAGLMDVSSANVMLILNSYFLILNSVPG